MWTVAFWKAAAERAVKTFAQSLVAYFVAGSVAGLFDVNWGDALSVAGLATLVSVLTSIGSSAVGPNGPSLGGEHVDSAHVEGH